MNTKNDVQKLTDVIGKHYGDKTLLFHHGYCFKNCSYSCVANIASVKKLLRRNRYLHLRFKDINSTKCNTFTRAPIYITDT